MGLNSLNVECFFAHLALSLLPTAVWEHVRSADNPADLATRGETPRSLRESTLWWTGPSWLLKEEAEWPNSAESKITTNIEVKKSAEKCFGFSTVHHPSFTEWCLRFSSVDKIIRILAYVHRWRNNSKLAPAERRKTWLIAAELAWGRRMLLRIVQRESFGQEVESLTSKYVVPNRSRLRRLLPFVDQEGILRVGGRLQNSYLSEAEKHPIILPSKHHITGLLVWKAHLSSLHGGPSLVQSQLSRQYWILRGRNFIRGVVRKCVKCARHRAATQTQQMGPLPAVRTRPARPFSFTGVDYAGPFLIRASPGRGQKSYKGYVAIFVCLVIKAVHLEVVSDYTAAAFLAAFRRFAARRGLCKIIYSDNGTTFRGAESELRRMFHATSSLSQQITAEVARDGVEWTYIPPRAPNFGGLWEANVKGFKYHLQRVIGETKLTFEEWSTVAAQIEACLNSRPLSPLSSSGDDVSALTPGHFLVGAPLVSPPEPFVEINETNSVCSRWHLLSLIQNHFWRRWRQEFLVQLQQRAKWLQPNHNFKVGDLVLFKDELMPPTKWPLARITRLFPGVDGLSRVASVRTSTTEYKRPISKLILLPVNSGASTGLNEFDSRMTGGSTQSNQPLWSPSQSKKEEGRENN